MTDQPKDEIIYFSPHFADSGHTAPWPESLVGRKAVGLARLPPNWTPPFFTITAKQNLDQVPRESVEAAISKLLALGTSDLIVRSSATDESLDDRGRYQSHRCEPSSSEVIATAKLVIRHFRELAEAQSTCIDQLMATIVQKYVSASRFGHLSNERRVSHEITSWHCEYQDSESESPHVRRFSIKHLTGADEEPTLACATSEQLMTCLRSVAKMFSKQRRRVHIEWLWDRQQLWIVQCDEEEVCQGDPPGSRWLGQSVPAVGSLQAMAPAVDAKEDWPKTQAIRRFGACGLPVARVFVLEDERILQQLATGDAPEKLRDDLEHLLAAPILMRTDYSERVLSFGMLLPRTGAVSSLDEAVAFLCKNSRHNIQQGIKPSDFCFTVHRFISARGAAFSFSKPGVSRVYIDSTWGGPDSLSFYPHDSFEVDTRDRAIVAKKVRCKTHYLDMDGNGEWIEVRSGEPWDWKPSLTNEELYEIAEGACRVANHLGKAVEVMYFTGVKWNTDKSICLPWFCTDKVASSIIQTTGVRFSGRRLTVVNKDDVNWIAERWESGELKKPFNLRLRPEPALLRSTELLEEVARVATAADVAVELEGSILQHCYYVLRQKGVRVTCVDVLEEATSQRRFGKLVRDKIPLRIESHGEKPLYLHVTTDELLHLLKSKAVEEALELFWETDKAHILEELTDLLEVIESAARLCDTTLEELSASAQKKREERGGFEEGVVLLETRSVPLITRELRELGLFKDDPDVTIGGHPQASSKRSEYCDTRHPKADASGLIISLVPPDVACNKKDAVITLHDGASEARVHYSGSEVHIAIGRHKKRVEDLRQLHFPFLDQDESPTNPDEVE